MKVRLANSDDYSAMRDIYAYFVENTSATFDYFSPSRTGFLSKMKNLTPDFPAFVAEEDGEIAGFCLLDKLFPEDGYRWNVSVKIYADKDRCGKGAGTMLERAAREASRYMGFRRMIAIATADTDAEKFFEKRGYEKIASFPSSGYKRGKVLGSSLFEKDLGDDETFKDRPKKMSAIRASGMDEFLALLDRVNGEKA